MIAGVGGQFVQQLQQLVNDDLSGLSCAELGADVVELQVLLDRLQYQLLRRLRRFERIGGPAAGGSLSTAAWLRHHSHLSGRAASSLVHTARRLEPLPPV